MPKSHAWLLALITVSLAATTAACTEKDRELSPAEKKTIASHVSKKAPSPAHPLEASFEGKVELVGYSVEPDVWKEGQKLKVTWYWKCNEELEEGWKLFTHVADAKGADRLNHDATGPIRQLYPPGQWEAGQYITDPQEMVLPTDWDSPSATLYVGLWNGPHRLQVVKGPNDGNNRVRAFTIKTAQATPAEAEAAAEANLPSLRVLEADEAPTIDGKLDDAVWKKAASTGRLVNTLNGSGAEPRARVQAAWDDTNLYVAFDVADDYLKSEFEKHDAHLWEQDAVEIMADPDGDGRNYFEMQVSPKGVSFDTRYDTRRMPKPFGHIDWDSHLDAKVAVRGTVGDDEADEGYTAEIAIPWKSFATGEPPAPPPSVGDTWHVNFYVMDAREKGQRAVGWSPTRTNDFHVPARFGRLLFVDAKGSGPPPAAAQGAKPAPAQAQPAGAKARKPSPAAAKRK